MTEINGMIEAMIVAGFDIVDSEVRCRAEALAALRWLADPANWTIEMSVEAYKPRERFEHAPLHAQFAAALKVRIKELDARYD